MCWVEGLRFVGFRVCRVQGLGFIGFWVYRVYRVYAV